MNIETLGGVTTSQQMLETVQGLKDEQRLIFQIDELVAKQLLYMNLQKKSFRNLFMSYINATTEEANVANFQQFWDRYSQLIFDEYELLKETAIKALGEESYYYLVDVMTPHAYYVDMERQILIVHTQGNDSIVIGGQCQCGVVSSI